MNLIKSTDYRLHLIAADVEQGVDVSALCTAMLEVCRKWGGVGLAAPQLGVPWRVILINCPKFKQEFINPVIVRRYGGKITTREGCLSYPGAEVLIVRDRQVIVDGFTADWRPIRRKLKGLHAICVQHEVDHLDGVTIV